MNQATMDPEPLLARPTLLSFFAATLARRGECIAAKSKHEGVWRELTWRELGERVYDLSDGLAELGVAPGDKVAILADTTVEWLTVYLAVLAAGAVAVPIYQSSRASDCLHIMEDAKVSFIALDSDAQAAKIRGLLPRLPALRAIIHIKGEARGEAEHDLADLMRRGASYRAANKDAGAARREAVTADSVACLLYTSGTTGSPKGVMLTHGNWTYEAVATCSLDLVLPYDTLFFILPLAHSFAQVVAAAWIYTGCVAAFAESIEKLVDNAGEVSPTVVPAVPRIFEKAYASIMQQGMAKRGFAGRLFRMSMAAFDAFATARENGERRWSLSLMLGKLLVFPKLSAALGARFGGRIRLFVSGGAPLSPKIAYFFDLLKISILEGYGLTETSAASCVNLIDHNEIGSVGPPVPGTEVRIDDDGEILIKGGGVMKGYWRNPAATSEAMQDGFYRTGDIGHLTATGALVITDRKKDIIVTAAGKNVAPQNLENELKADALISQAMVHGDKRKFLSVLLTLNEEAARAWACAHDLASLTHASLVQHPLLCARVQRTVDAVNEHQARYATIKKFAILPQDFTIESGELTPTLKVKRKVCADKYRHLLDRFYAEDGPGGG